MKKLNTKTGVFLTTYTQIEIDENIESLLEVEGSEGCVLFMDELRSFNPDSENCVTEKEAIELTGWEISQVQGETKAMYTNYKGTPLGIPINGASLYYTNPIASLKSAFEIAATEFDFEQDFFHIKIVK